MTHSTQNASVRTSHEVAEGEAHVGRHASLGPASPAEVPTPGPITAGSSKDASSGRPIAAADQRSPIRSSRPKRWSVLDFIWAFGDYGSKWSATFKADSSVVVSAHDGVVLGQFVLDLTKAILNGLGREFLSRHTQFDGCRYVVAADYQLIAESEPEAGDGAATRADAPSARLDNPAASASTDQPPASVSAPHLAGLPGHGHLAGQAGNAGSRREVA